MMLPLLRRLSDLGFGPALFFIALQFIMAAMPMAPSVSDAYAGQKSAASQQIILCTSDGIKRITITKDGEPVAPEESHEYADCDWCHSFGKIVDLSNAADVDKPVLFESAGKAFSLGKDIHLKPLAHTFHSRGPPIFRAI